MAKSKGGRRDIFTQENAIILFNSIVLAALGVYLFRNANKLEIITFLIAVGIAFGKGRMSHSIFEPAIIFAGVLLIMFFIHNVIPKVSATFNGGYLIASALLLLLGIYLLVGGFSLKFGAKK